jgi:putative RNA 2'-phosphotransferase
MEDDLVKHSKFMSLILRHKPEKVGLTLGDGGWVNTFDLIKAMNDHNYPITLDTLITVVEDNDKKRFSFNHDRSMIRAAQGHSVDVKLDYRPKRPPDRLHHGTVYAFLKSIKQTGLDKGKRHAVHLSEDYATAVKVGSRRGDPVILIIKAKEMHEDGYSFFQSDNGVWLTDFVLPKYIIFPND